MSSERARSDDRQGLSGIANTRRLGPLFRALLAAGDFGWLTCAVIRVHPWNSRRTDERPASDPSAKLATPLTSERDRARLAVEPITDLTDPEVELFIPSDDVR